MNTPPTPGILFEQLRSQIVLERNQGLDSEVTHILPGGWTRQATPDGYTFVAPLSEPNEDDVWRVIRFLTYKSLFACRRTDSTDHREYEVVSCTESGVGFRLLFHLTR